MALTTIKVNMVDADGERATTAVHMVAGTDPSTLSALTSALDGISSLGITGLTASYFDATAGEAAESGPYDSAGDRIVMEFTGSQGSPVTFSVPAPVAECFEADGDTPDMAFLQTYIDAIEANVKDSGGGAISFARAYRDWNSLKSE